MQATESDPETGEKFDRGCFFEPFKITASQTTVIELGELSISDPTVINGFKIQTHGYVNDNFALAIGQNTPEQVIWQLPNNNLFDFFNIDTSTSVTVQNKSFKVFLLVHQYYRTLTPSQWLERAVAAPMATVSEVQGAMSAQCSAYDSDAKEATDGFYGKELSISLLFD